jgi:parallel beta-helix repeat protein
VFAVHWVRGRLGQYSAPPTYEEESTVLTRMTIAAGTLGASLAFAGSALAAPSPYSPHGRHHATHHHAVRQAVTPATSGAKLYVNGGSGSDQGGANTCRLSTNPCATIGHAISVAPTTATITVAGGNYPEQLNITGKNLTINGAGSTRTIIDPTTLQTDNNDPNTSSPQAVVVEFQNTSSGGLSNLTVDGTTAGSTEPTDGSCDQDFVGVEFANASGTLSSDAVTGIQEQQSFFGCQQGLAVYVANNNGGPDGVTMKTLAVTKYQKDGIDCDNAGTTCTISGSTVTGIGPTGLTAQNGIETDAGVTASIKSSTVTGNSYTSPDYTTNGTFFTASGILAYDTTNLTVSSNKVNNNDENIVGFNDGTGPAQGAWLISKNTVTAATNNTGAVPLGDSVGDGIDLYGTGGAGSSTDVYGNTVSNNADWGIALFGALNATVGGTATGERNTVSQNADDGIFLGEFSAGFPSSNNTVTNNLVKGNKDDGILAAGPDSTDNQQATGNMFQSNLLQTNARYDAEDLSTGGGPGTTAGTANSWMGNVCKPAKDSNPLGLCS